MKIAKTHQAEWTPQRLHELANEYRALADELDAKAKLPKGLPAPARKSDKRARRK